MRQLAAPPRFSLCGTEHSNVRMEGASETRRSGASAFSTIAA